MFEIVIDLMLCTALFHALAFNCIQASNETFNGSLTYRLPEDKEYENDYQDKPESFQRCMKYLLDPDEYILFPNKTVYVEIYNKSYTEDYYYLEGDVLLVCQPDTLQNSGKEPIESKTLSEQSDTLSLFANIGLGVSMVCLVIHLIVFGLVADMRNLPGCYLASLCFSLLVSYVLAIVARADEVHENELPCAIIAVMKLYFFLASFFWMFVISLDICRTIHKAMRRLRSSPKDFNLRKFCCSSLIAWGASMVFAAAAAIVDNIDGVDETFKPQFKIFCWFKERGPLLTFFAVPVFALIVLNFIFFGVSAYNICANEMLVRDSQQSNLNHVKYFRLATIMGVTWIVGALAPFVDRLWMWYLFAALNTFQGLFIFAAFTCCDKAKKHFQKKLSERRKFSKQDLLSTFHSSYYDNWIRNILYISKSAKDKNQS